MFVLFSFCFHFFNFCFTCSLAAAAILVGFGVRGAGWAPRRLSSVCCVLCQRSGWTAGQQGSRAEAGKDKAGNAAANSRPHSVSQGQANGIDPARQPFSQPVIKPASRHASRHVPAAPNSTQRRELNRSRLISITVNHLHQIPPNTSA